MKKLTTDQSFLDKCFKDKNNKVTIGQRPNLPILLFLSFFLLSKVVESPNLQEILSSIGTLFLFAWAWLELTTGANYLRRLLGFTVIVVIIYGILN